MDPQMVHVYVLGDRLFAVPMSKTDVGVWAGLDGPIEGALADSDMSLGSLVEDALGQSRIDRPHPEREQLGRVLEPLLRATGIRRSGEFHRRAGLVSVERNGHAYRLARRTKVLEKGTGHAWFSDEAISRDLAAPSKAELGAVIRELSIATESLKMKARTR